MEELKGEVKTIGLRNSENKKKEGVLISSLFDFISFEH